MRTSADEGAAWSEPTRCIAAPGYFVVNNDRVIQLGKGRIVVPAAYHRPTRTGQTDAQNEVDWRAISLYYYSDDEGKTWHESADWWGLPVRNKSGMQEPGLVELKDGSLYAWARTDTAGNGNVLPHPGQDVDTATCFKISLPLFRAVHQADSCNRRPAGRLERLQPALEAGEILYEIQLGPHTAGCRNQRQ